MMNQSEMRLLLKVKDLIIWHCKKSLTNVLQKSSIAALIF